MVLTSKRFYQSPLLAKMKFLFIRNMISIAFSDNPGKKDSYSSCSIEVH